MFLYKKKKATSMQDVLTRCFDEDFIMKWEKQCERNEEISHSANELLKDPFPNKQWEESTVTLSTKYKIESTCKRYLSCNFSNFQYFPIFTSVSESRAWVWNYAIKKHLSPPAHLSFIVTIELTF